ncbi:hypothetical protein KKB18_12130 [bacterium]|nr:hypothetical protein [bacterium]
MLEKYLKSIATIKSRRVARKESFKHCLLDLLNHYILSEEKTNIHVTSSPKETNSLNPDFRVLNVKQKIIGYIDTKLPYSNLDKTLNTYKFKLFLSTFPNLILTNFYEFRLYRYGTMHNRTKIAFGKINHKFGTIPPVKDPFEFFDFLDQFLTFIQPIVYSSKSLALELSKKTRYLETSIYKLLYNDKKRRTQLLSFCKIFDENLSCVTTKKQYSDLIAQSIVFCLFLSRTLVDAPFTRKNAVNNFPESYGILHDILKFLSHDNLLPEIEWITDDIAEILDNADIKTILGEIFTQCKEKNETFYFFKFFLGVIDPEQLKLVAFLFQLTMPAT